MDKYKKKETWKSIVSIILVVLLAFGAVSGFSVLFKKESKSSGNSVKVVSCMDTFVNTKLADYTKLDFEFAGKGIMNFDGTLDDPFDDLGEPYYSTEFISFEGYNEMIIKANPSFFYDKVTVPDLDVPDTYLDIDPLIFMCYDDKRTLGGVQMSDLDCNLVAVYGEYSFISIKVPEDVDPVPVNKVSLIVYEKAKDALEIWVK